MKLPERKPLPKPQLRFQVASMDAFYWVAQFAFSFSILQLPLFVSEKASYQEKWSIAGVLQLWNYSEVP